MKFLNRLFRYHATHIIRLYDIATGVSDGFSTPLTGWRYKCVLCGKIIEELTPSGIEQLATYKPEDAIQWMEEERTIKENE